ncbi:MAG: class I SAM-dependent methyltransferase [Blastocatellia bacterium]|nr:class I SAM-dependent methyltransferase [Blastocatellia bacterium]
MLQSVERPEELKQKVREFWNENPCGTKFAQAEIGTVEFFNAIEKHRYETEWHILEMANFPAWKGKTVLEVGCGLGTDAVQFARAGAIYTGVDLTPRSIELVGKRFQQQNLTGNFQVADAENLPFPDNHFDLVYSHGVLHHTPDTQKAINEVHRVIKPGGRALVMLYHRNSYNYYGNIMFFRRFGAKLLQYEWGPKVVNLITKEDINALKRLQNDMKKNPEQFFSQEEFLNQNTDGAGNPLARVYNRSEAAQLFSRFGKVETAVRFLNKRWIPIIGKFLPKAIESPLARLWGWHLWIIANK